MSATTTYDKSACPKDIRIASKNKEDSRPGAIKYANKNSLQRSSQNSIIAKKYTQDHNRKHLIARAVEKHNALSYRARICAKIEYIHVYVSCKGTSTKVPS